MERYLLLRDGEPISLSPKVFETLLFLVQNRGRIGKKDEIINSVWPDTFVEESNLAQNVFLLRKALGEEKNEHRYIVTIPGVGYRFVAAVREFDTPNLQTQSEPSSIISSIAVLPFKDLLGDDDEKFWGPGLADALIMRLSSIRELRFDPPLQCFATPISKKTVTNRTRLKCRRLAGWCLSTRTRQDSSVSAVGERQRRCDPVGREV